MSGFTEGRQWANKEIQKIKQLVIHHVLGGEDREGGAILKTNQGHGLRKIRFQETDNNSTLNKA